MVISDKNKRLIIYFFYDKKGIVDDYVIYMLNSIKEHTDKILFVSNGEVSKSSVDELDGVADDFLIRENKGFDVWAYKEGMEYIGYEDLLNYDEVILMNFTIMGPLYPFSEMFEKMNKKDIDFWGLTIFHGAPFDPFNKIEYGYLPTHIQSHFIAIRKNMLSSEIFRKYWENMPNITSYEEAICWHEAIFTKKFSDSGFKWESYIDTIEDKERTYTPILMTPLDLVKNKRCPIIKRRSFFHDYYDFLEFTNGEPTVKLYEYIKNNTDYNTDLIWDNILRTQNQADIHRCMHLNYILSADVYENNQIEEFNKKVALVMHVYFEDLIEYCFEYAKSVSKYADVYITTDTLDKKEKIENIFSKMNWKKFSVILIENRGRDVSSLLVGFKDYIKEYEYVCFAHDKKVSQLYMSIKGESFSYKCFENILKNEIFVKNIIDTFENNPRLGILSPPPPNFGEYYPTLGRVDWGCNFTNTVNIAKKMNIEVDFDYEKEPIAPLGTMFWFRSKALKPLYDLNWQYSDFPEEPNSNDGSLLHAIERVYPFVAQSEGYYPGWILNKDFANLEMDNLYFMLRELNKCASSIYGPNTHYNLINTMKMALYEGHNVTQYQENKIIKRVIKEKIKRRVSPKLWEKLKKVYRKLKNNILRG